MSSTTLRRLIVMALIVLWEVLPRIGAVPELFLPSLSSTLQAGQLSWVAGEAPQNTHLSAKTRYRQADMACAFDSVQVEAGENFALRFSDPQWAVTPGQSAVLYDGDVCLGGGIIESSGI